MREKFNRGFIKKHTKDFEFAQALLEDKYKYETKIDYIYFITSLNAQEDLDEYGNLKGRVIGFTEKPDPVNVYDYDMNFCEYSASPNNIEWIII